MTDTDSKGTLAKALVAFQKELPRVGKDKTANAGTFSYKYTDLATLVHTMTPILTKHGLSFVVTPRATESGYEAVGVLMHVSGESIEGALPIYGRQPQEMGSSLSYARRYLAGCLTGIVADQDDDGAAAVKSSRTTAEPVVDWGMVIDSAAGLSSVEALRELWKAEGVSKAPRAVQETIKQLVEDAKNREPEDGETP